MSPRNDRQTIAGLRKIAMPVVVVAAAHAGARSCATATVMYGSIEPPTVVVSLSAASTTLRLTRESGRFAVSVLSDAQRDIAMAAGRRSPGVDKFAVLGIEPITDGPAAGLGIPGSLTVLVCDVLVLVEAGDHECVIGKVRAVVPGDPSAVPLVRVQRSYARVGSATDIDRTYPI